MRLHGFASLLQQMLTSEGVCLYVDGWPAYTLTEQMQNEQLIYQKMQVNEQQSRQHTPFAAAALV